VKVTTEKPEPGVATLTVELPPEDFTTAVDKALTRIAGRTSVPGFRRGKAPRNLVRRQVGEAAVNEEAINHLVPESYDKAVEELGLSPIERPKLSLVQADPGEPLIFTATVALRPEVTLGEYSSVEIEPEVIDVSDEAVDRVIAQLRESRATWEPKDGTVGADDMIIADIVMDLESDPESGNRRTERNGSEIIIGKNGFPPGFDSGVDGMSVGDTRKFAVIWPAVPRTAEDGETEVAPREALFTVTVHELRHQSLPVVDDEFVKSVSEGQFETRDDLLADIRARLTVESLRNARSRTENKVVDAAIAGATFEIPARLIELEAHYLEDEERESFARRRMTIERYLQLTGQTQESWHAQLHEAAERQIKARTLLDAIVEREGLVVDTSEVDREVAETAASYPTDAARVRKELNSADSRRRISTSILRHKAIEKLVGYVGGYPEPTTVTSSELSDGQSHSEAEETPSE